MAGGILSYLCHYTHTSRNSVSPVSKIFTELVLWADLVYKLNIHEAWKVVTQCCAFFFKCLITPIYICQSQNFDYKKIPFTKEMKGHWSQSVQLWLRNVLKLPRGKSIFFGQLTRKAWHMTCDTGHRTSETWHLI